MQIIAGKYRGRKIQTLKGDNTRPTLGHIRESVFNILQSEVEDSLFLDLFAGSGAMGIEALSRGAERVVFVEKNRSAIEVILKNLEKIDDSYKVLKQDWKKALALLEKQNILFDILYVDPPYCMYNEKGFCDSLISSLRKIIHANSVIMLEVGVNDLIQLDQFEDFQIKTRTKGTVVLYEIRLK
ncbi:MAG TPA: 16S rRNA (guanine(966)-N(2))-methyltransferase RsmD [Chlamydiales bacterium]|nr:16S rRNA (guanine(966)-N(2))-methyltransferase RsmD [Chlamydiales bacterium]